MDWRRKWRRFRSVRHIVPLRSTDNVGASLSATWDLAAERGHSSISPEHVLAGMVLGNRRKPHSVLRRLGIVLDIKEASGLTDPARPEMLDGDPEFDPSTRILMDSAREQARDLGHPYIGTEHLLLALLLGPDRPSKDFLERHGVVAELIRKGVAKVSA